RPAARLRQRLHQVQGDPRQADGSAGRARAREGPQGRALLAHRSAAVPREAVPARPAQAPRPGPGRLARRRRRRGRDRRGARPLGKKRARARFPGAGAAARRGTARRERSAARAPAPALGHRNPRLPAARRPRPGGDPPFLHAARLAVVRDAAAPADLATMDRLAKAIELAHENLEAPRVQRFEYTRTRTVPASPDALRAHHVSVGEERTPIAEAFKRLRTQLLQRLRDSGRRVLGVSSPRSGEGKTTVALNLAVHTALEADWTVLLVDADLRRPGLCRALGLGPLPGLAQFLAGEAPLEELLVYPGFGRCVLLPAGAARTDP